MVPLARGLGISHLENVENGINDQLVLIKENRYYLDNWISLKILVIDNAHDLSASFFDWFITLARAVRGSTTIFGGITFIFFSNMHATLAFSTRTAYTNYLFNSRLWLDGITKYLFLSGTEYQQYLVTKLGACIVPTQQFYNFYIRRSYRDIFDLLHPYWSSPMCETFRSLLVILEEIDTQNSVCFNDLRPNVQDALRLWGSFIYLVRDKKIASSYNNNMTVLFQSVCGASNGITEVDWLKIRCRVIELKDNDPKVEQSLLIMTESDMPPLDPQILYVGAIVILLVPYSTGGSTAMIARGTLGKVVKIGNGLGKEVVTVTFFGIPSMGGRQCSYGGSGASITVNICPSPMIFSRKAEKGRFLSYCSVSAFPLKLANFVSISQVAGSRIPDELKVVICLDPEAGPFWVNSGIAFSSICSAGLLSPDRVHVLLGFPEAALPCIESVETLFFPRDAVSDFILGFAKYASCIETTLATVSKKRRPSRKLPDFCKGEIFFNPSVGRIFELVEDADLSESPMLLLKPTCRNEQGQPNLVRFHHQFVFKCSELF